MIKLTRKLPDKPGYYWWTNFGEHTPCILRVEKSSGGRGFYASNEEYGFTVSKDKASKKDDIAYITGKGDYRYGESLWGYIENPEIDGNEVEPDSF